MNRTIPILSQRRKSRAAIFLSMAVLLCFLLALTSCGSGSPAATPAQAPYPTPGTHTPTTGPYPPPLTPMPEQPYPGPTPPPAS
jgi:hypothetical protein